MTIDLGSDFETVNGQLLPDMRLMVSSDDKARAYLACCARRLTMPNGSLALLGDADAGLDMREYVNDTETPAVAEQAINGELLKDERTARCSTAISVNPDGSWEVTTNPQAQDGAVYKLVFVVTSADAALLSAGLA